MLGVELKLMINSEEARARLLAAITDPNTLSLTLGTIMLGLNEEAKVTFPSNSKIPVFLGYMENMDMADAEYYASENSLSLAVTTEEDSWVFDRQQGMPVRASEMEEDLEQ